MFTMKKFAILALSGFIASSMIACGEDGDDDDGGTTPPVQLPTSWGKSGSVTLGNGDKGSAGSFLDADTYPLSAITKANAASKKDVIDLVLTGDKLITPLGCATVTFCKTELSGTENDAAVFLDMNTSSLSATSTPQDIQNAIQTQNVTNVLNEVSVIKGGKYVMFTNDGTAYIIVNDIGNEGSLTIGYIADAD